MRCELQICIRKIWRCRTFVLFLQKTSEAAVAFAEPEIQDIPEGMAYANIVNDILQVTPDIEEEIAEVERGEVSMGEFKTMFAKWL